MAYERSMDRGGFGEQSGLHLIVGFVHRLTDKIQSPREEVQSAILSTTELEVGGGGIVPDAVRRAAERSAVIEAQYRRNLVLRPEAFVPNQKVPFEQSSSHLI